MTVEQAAEYLLSKNRRFDRNVIYDTDKHGSSFCELFIQNTAFPSLPITVTVTDRGCCVSVGQFDNVTGSRSMTPDQTLSVIDDISQDKIIFVLGYRDDEDIGFGSPFFSRVFAITGGEDDMQAEYEDFLEKISKPIYKKLRFLTPLKGRFLIFNFSGSLKNTIIR